MLACPSPALPDEGGNFELSYPRVSIESVMQYASSYLINKVLDDGKYHGIFKFQKRKRELWMYCTYPLPCLSIVNFLFFFHFIHHGSVGLEHRSPYGSNVSLNKIRIFFPFQFPYYNIPDSIFRKYCTYFVFIG